MDDLKPLVLARKTLGIGLLCWLVSWLVQDWWWPIPAANFWAAALFGVAAAFLTLTSLWRWGEVAAPTPSLLWFHLLDAAGACAALCLQIWAVIYFWQSFGWLLAAGFAFFLSLIIFLAIIMPLTKAIRYATGNPEYRPKEARTPRE